MTTRAPIRQHRGFGSREKQTGLALVALILFIMVAFGFFGLRQLNSNVRQTVVSSDAERMLARAKEALIAYTIYQSPAAGTADSPGRMPWPDVVTDTAPNYDGLSESNCVNRTWVSGTALPVTTTSAQRLARRCVGRFPWKTVGLSIDHLPPENDPDGIMPWLAFSPRLMRTTSPEGCAYINSNRINDSTSAGADCGANWPWITVVDAKGVVLTNRAAAVIIIPGPKLFTQNRTIAPLADSSAYLDRVVVQAGCTMPCIPGTYDNSRRRILGFSTALDNATGLRFIQCADISTVASNDPNYAHPYRCNDKLTWITIDELMEHAERRALTEAKAKIQNFFDQTGYLPYASPVGEMDIDCADKSRSAFGHIPSGPVALNKCPAGSPAFTTQTTPVDWFALNLWAEAIYYHPAPSCLENAPVLDCNSDLLQVGSNTKVKALLIATGLPITAAPFAESTKGSPPVGPGSPQRGWNNTGSTLISDYLDSNLNAAGGASKRYDAVNTRRTNSYKDQLLIVTQLP